MNSRKILIVEDSIFVSKIVNSFLTKNGYITTSVSTGEEAIDIIVDGYDIDLILMDIELGSTMNGLSAATKILKIREIPIIFLTASSSKEIMDEIKEIKAYGFVEKGGDNYALLSTIEMALNLYDATVQTREFTERLRNSYDELKNSRREYLVLTEDAPVGILKCDYGGKITFVNKKALEILGSPGKKATKEVNLLEFPTLVKAGLSQKLRECLINRVTSVHDVEYESLWGKRVYMRTHIKPIRRGKSVAGAQIIIDDITEKKAMETELRRLSSTDPLTDAYNRRYFLTKLDEEIEKSTKESSLNFSIAMLDIDHFKSINDLFGHNIGDLVLKRVTKILQKSVRKMDCVARWGGEEFILLLPGMRLNEAALLADELRYCISELKMPVEKAVTVSFGVANYSGGESADELLKRADNLLYKAKGRGRNCVAY